MKPYYDEKGITIYHTDCLPAMKEMPDNAFDLAIVDPPYGIGNPNHEPKTSNLYTGKNWNNAIPPPEYFSELFRVSCNQIVWGSNYYTKWLPMKMGWIAWDKMIPGNPNGFSKIELAWTSFKIGDEIVRQRVYQTDKIHPTQKPVALYKWLLTNYAKPGQTILDTHLGSGSSAIACDVFGFDLTAFEIDLEYIEAATDRLKRHRTQGVLEL